MDGRWAGEVLNALLAIATMVIWGVICYQLAAGIANEAGGDHTAPVIEEE